jgi:hypothetical protein
MPAERNAFTSLGAFTSFGAFTALVVLVALGALVAPAAARAAPSPRHRLTVTAGADTWFRPEIGFHGFGMAAYDLEGLPRGSHLGLEWNTTRLRASYDRLRLAGGTVEAGFFVEGELFIAGLLSDYFRRAELDPARAFNASYVHLGTEWKALLPRAHFLSFAATGKRWFFSRTDDTAAALVLPPEAWVVRLRWSYTYWGCGADCQRWRRHRLFPRVTGVAFGVNLQTDLREEGRAWGALDPAVFDPVDPRNHPGGASASVRQWLRAGWQLHPRVRTQLYQTAGWGDREDDLVRARIGGTNPYHLPLAGAAWSTFLAERFFTAHWSWHFRVFRDIELGVLADLAVLADPLREGDDRAVGVHAGVGAFVDFRWGPWQADLRGGWSPTLRWLGPAGNFTAYLGLGYAWDWR